MVRIWSYFDMQPGEPGIEPPPFWLTTNLLYLLSHRHPEIVTIDAKFLIKLTTSDGILHEPNMFLPKFQQFWFMYTIQKVLYF